MNNHPNYTTNSQITHSELLDQKLKERSKYVCNENPGFSVIKENPYLAQLTGTISCLILRIY